MSALARISEIGSITDCECVETGASIYSLTILVSKIRREAFCVSGLGLRKLDSLGDYSNLHFQLTQNILRSSIYHSNYSLRPQILYTLYLTSWKWTFQRNFHINRLSCIISNSQHPRNTVKLHFYYY